MILLVAVATLVALSEQCQEIRMIAEDGTVIVSRSMEFAVMNSALITEPAGTEHIMPDLPNCEEAFRFESRYHAFKVRWKGEEWSKGDADGMNSAGLSFSGLYFPQFSHFPDPEEVRGEDCDHAVPHIRLGEYVLATFATVQEIRDALDNGTFPMVYIEADFDIKHPVHFQFIDHSGDGLVLEYTEDRGRRTYNNTVGVFTNSPTYDWHMENLRNYPQLRSVNRQGYGWEFLGKDYYLPTAGSGSGLAGIPGDYTSVSRFVKAATLVKYAEKPKNKMEALVQSFHLMNAADIPRGIVQIPMEESDSGKGKDKGKGKGNKNKKNKKGKKKQKEDDDDEDQEKPEFLSDSTSYIVVKSLEEGCMYYRAYMDLSIKRICFKDMRTDVSRWINLEGKWSDSFEDINTRDMRVFEFDGEN